MLASLAPGETRIIGASGARHVRSTIEVLRGLGTGIDQDETGFVVHGGPYRPRRNSVSVGSSGTTLYFMIGLAALGDAPVTLTGQKYFQPRPVGPLLGALAQLGVRLESQDARPPITVAPSRPTGGHVRISGTLSQWISGLLLLAPFATRPTVVEVDGVLNEQPYVELTVRMMRDFGLEVGVSDDWRRFEIEPGQEAQATEIVLPPDIGSAAFGLPPSPPHPSDAPFPRVRPPPASCPAGGARPWAARSTIPRRTSSTCSPRWACRWSSTRRPAGCACVTTASSCAACASTAGRCPTCCPSSRRSGPSRPAGPCSRTSSTSA